MTRKFLTAVLAILLVPLLGGGGAEANDCSYDAFIRGDSCQEVVIVDELPDDLKSRSASFIISTDDGPREGECARLNGFQTLCVLGIRLPTEPANPCTQADGTTGSLLELDDGRIVCRFDSPATPATPVAVPVPSFTA